jgi:ribulose-5-phosphate 4-epimerase/fuculose-1-phosphate aldolase
MTTPSPGQVADNNDHLVQSDNPDHPANLIPSLCAKFWTLGWVTGTGGGASIREEYVPRTSSTFGFGTPPCPTITTAGWEKTINHAPSTVTSSTSRRPACRRS